MVWIDAGAVIAPMQNERAFRDRPDKGGICPSMREQMTIAPEVTIAMATSRLDPVPAFRLVVYLVTGREPVLTRVYVLAARWSSHNRNIHRQADRRRGVTETIRHRDGPSITRKQVAKS